MESRTTLQKLCKIHKSKMGDVKCNSKSIIIQKKLNEIGVLPIVPVAPPRRKSSTHKKSVPVAPPRKKSSTHKKSAPVAPPRRKLQKSYFETNNIENVLLAVKYVKYNNVINLCKTNSLLNSVCSDNRFWYHYIGVYSNKYNKSVNYKEKAYRIANTKVVKKYFPGTNKIEFETEYFKGKKDGLFRSWYKNGILYEEITYKEGKKHGLSRHWYQNGQLQQEYTYKNDKKDGLYRYWYENGQLVCGTYI